MSGSSQPNPLAGKALDYLIGADGPQRGKEGRITETPFGVGPSAVGRSIAYCNLRREDGEPPTYRPYLPHDDIYEQYGEGRPNPKGQGFRRNIIEQLDRAKQLGHTLVEEDNPDSYPSSAVMLGLDLAQERGLGVTAKNPGLMKEGAQSYVAHPNVFGIIVEKDCGTPTEMDELRRKAGKPELPVWFVSYGDGRDWAMRMAQEIKSARYVSMGVTYSSVGEYGNSEDVLLPITAQIPQAATMGTTGASAMDTNQAQTILSEIGLLDPPADGVLGPVTKWALDEACKGACVPFDGSTITDAIGQALAAEKPLPLTLGNDLAGRIVSAMIAKGHWVARHPDCLNIVYVEGMNADGTPNGNVPNEFNDRRMVIRIGAGGVPKIEGSWEGTTEPGRYWTEHPMNSRGAARIAFGQFKSWRVGDYHGNESLLQAAPITVYRDLAQDYKREGAPDVGDFGIHQHWGYDLPKNDLDRSSAGCLVGRMKVGHQEFMALVKTDARYKANPNYKFVTTILPVESLTGIDMPTPILAPHLVPTTAAALPASMTQETIDQISRIAGESDLARYDWDGRGAAPRGYIKGMAVTFAHVYSKWKAGDSAARVMAAANSGNDNIDALSWYDSKFRAAGMNNAAAGAATLRHLFVLLIGLGMRESSGRYCEGRDRSANNVTADTAEAGLFQMSWNARSASPELPKLFAAYSARPEGFLSLFQEGVRCTESDLSNYGTGEGAEFQRLCKSCPAFAAEAAAVGLRAIRKHWGPINRQEAEVRPEGNKLLQQVQDVIDGLATVSKPVPQPQPVEPPMTDTPAQQQIDVAALAAQVQALGASVRSILTALDQLKTVIPAGTPPVVTPIPAPLPTPTSTPAQQQIDVAALAAQVQALGASVRSILTALDQLKTVIPAGTPPVVTPIPAPLPTPTSTPVPQIDVGALAQVLQSLRPLVPLILGIFPQTRPLVPALSTIDKWFGGAAIGGALTGKKTGIGVLGLASTFILHALGQVGAPMGEAATPMAQILTTGFGGLTALGLTAKLDRGLLALSALATAMQNLPASAPTLQLPPPARPDGAA
jgi:hypothetical protein